MSDKETYLARAAEARAESEAATLDNVRERCLRSEAAWKGMAARVELTDQLRAKRQAESAASEDAANIAEHQMLHLTGT